MRNETRRENEERREEDDGRISHDYKGPNSSRLSRKKPFLSFNINYEVAQMLRQGYLEDQVIRKEREIWTAGNFQFYVDTVYRTRRGKTQYIGRFIEVDLLQENARDNMEDLLKKLGLSRVKRILQSYTSIE